MSEIDKARGWALKVSESLRELSKISNERVASGIDQIPILSKEKKGILKTKIGV